MIMKQMLDSLPILQRVMELKLPIKKAHEVYSLAKQINEQRDFFIKEEKKLIDKFNAKAVDNKVHFKSDSDQASFVKEYAELMQFKVENCTPINLSFDDLGSAEFSPIEIGLLEGVINFLE